MHTVAVDGWTRGGPQKPPAMWAPPLGNAQPQGKRDSRKQKEGKKHLGNLRAKRRLSSDPHSLHGSHPIGPPVGSEKSSKFSAMAFANPW